MATESVEIECKNGELKHLGFVRIATIHVMVLVSNLYDYAKNNSGPLRSTVGSVEGAVTSVVGPVYEKFKGVPSDLLVFVDKKVDEATHKFDEHAPPLAKQVVSKAQGIVHKASEKAQALVHEAQVGGPGAAVHYATAESKHFLLAQSVKVWLALDQIAPFHGVAEMAVPTAAHWSQKYNHAVTDLTGKGYTVFSYLPLVPIKEIAKEFKQSKAGKEGDADAAHDSHDSSSDSD